MLSLIIGFPPVISIAFSPVLALLVLKVLLYIVALPVLFIALALGAVLLVNTVVLIFIVPFSLIIAPPVISAWLNSIVEFVMFRLLALLLTIAPPFFAVLYLIVVSLIITLLVISIVSVEPIGAVFMFFSKTNSISGSITMLLIAPASSVAVLLFIVEWVIVKFPFKFPIAPILLALLFSKVVLLIIIIPCELKTAPTFNALLFFKVLLSIVIFAQLSITSKINGNILSSCIISYLGSSVLTIAPPIDASLFSNVVLLMFTIPPSLKIAPPYSAELSPNVLSLRSIIA